MDRCAAAILLMLPLVALVVSADNIIRLPSDAVMDEAKPWECCDIPRCTRAGMCGCKDVLEECAAGCKNCQPVDLSDPAAGKMCRDATWGGAPPRCTLATACY